MDGTLTQILSYLYEVQVRAQQLEAALAQARQEIADKDARIQFLEAEPPKETAP